jgi:hypothetical protein
MNSFFVRKYNTIRFNFYCEQVMDNGAVQHILTPYFDNVYDGRSLYAITEGIKMFTIDSIQGIK